MKSLNPGLVGTGGTGIGSSPALPPEEGLIGVVLITETRTRFGESWQKITGGGPGGSRSAIAEPSRAAVKGTRRERERRALRGGTAPLSAPVSRDGPCSSTEVPRPPPPVAARARLSRSSLRTAAPCGLAGLPSAPLRLRGHPRTDPPSQRRPPAMAAAGTKQSQRPRTFPKRCRPRWQPRSRRCPRRSRRRRCDTSALAARAEPQVFPRYVSRPSAANHPARRECHGESVPAGQPLGGKVGGRASRGGARGGEAVRRLPSYWIEPGRTAPDAALIGLPRQGRGESWAVRPGRFGALWLWAGCAGQ